MKRYVVLIGLALFGLTGPRASSAQVPDPAQVMERAAAAGLSQADVLERLRQSGLSRQQVQARLRQAGLDPSLADRYFDALEGGDLPQGRPSRAFVEALGAMPADTPTVAVPPPDSIAADSAVKADADTLDAEPADSASLPIFGRSVFAGATTQFDPVVLGPVDPDYRLGPGDEIRLVLTGDVELAYTLSISREGYLIIPDVGQVFVNGLTLGELEDRLYARLGGAYSGITRGPEATTHFQVSLGKLHANQVFLIGEVERPSAYQVSAVATVFNALYRAGGPSETGSFRRIEVRRAGEIVRTVDLYDYLLRGDSRDDIRLMQGDIVFVPVAGRRVRVRGAVRRPAIYELAEGEGVRDLIRYAAGFEAEAVVDRIQIDRILPPEERRPGVDRVLIDVDVDRVANAEGPPITVRDGDVVNVFAVGEERRHRVVLTGSVNRPGLYEWSPGLTLGELIDRASGLHELAYTARAHIFRLNEEDGSRRLIRTPLIADSAGRAVRDVAIADRDSVVIFSRGELRNETLVTIDGFVKEPGTYPLAEGMTLEDLVLAAGGFTRGAYVLEAELARRPDPMVRTDTTAHVLRVPLSPVSGGDAAGPARRETAFSYAAGRDGAVDGAVAGWTPSADELMLRHGDHVFIRKAPGYEEAHTVTVTGEVALPGRYVLRTREETLVDLVERAGGLTSEAYAPGARLVRGGELVGTRLDEALERPGGDRNVTLVMGDSVHVPAYDPTVLVRGAVAFETRALFEGGAGLGHYISQAGGYADVADKGNVSVLYANGERETVGRFLVFSASPDIEPGSTIYVPTLPPAERGGFDWTRFVTTSMSLMTTTATLLLAIDRL